MSQKGKTNSLQHQQELETGDDNRFDERGRLMFHLFIFLFSCFSKVDNILTLGLTDEQIASESDQMKMVKLNSLQRERLTKNSMILSSVVSFESQTYV